MRHKFVVVNDTRLSLYSIITIQIKKASYGKIKFKGRDG